jgi:hypothetical protein
MTSTATTEPLHFPGQCYVSVYVYNGDYDEAEEYIRETTVNGQQVHGSCSPTDGAPVDQDNFFTCANVVPLPV